MVKNTKTVYEIIQNIPVESMIIRAWLAGTGSGYSKGTEPKGKS